MADINNFTEITENFDTIKTLLNSIRAQGVLNTSDVDKLLAGINTKLEKINTEEDIDLIKIFLTELKQNLDERHSVLISKFGAIESLFSNLLKNSSETIKSSEVKELFDIVATNLSVFSREVVSQKEALSDITLRIDAMRSDDSQKKDILKNVAVLKNDLERLTNGFDSIVLNLNENYKTIVKNIASIDPTENITKFGRELEDIATSSNAILSAIQMIDKKNLHFEDLLNGLATQDSLNNAKKWISDLVDQDQKLTDSVNQLSDKYYKIDNLADKIDASVDLIAGLKSLVTERGDQSAIAVVDRLSALEEAVKNISSELEFEDFKESLLKELNNFNEKSNGIKSVVVESSQAIKEVQAAIDALDLNVSFQAVHSGMRMSEENIKEFVTQETDKVLQLVDVNSSRTLNELSTNADNFTEHLQQAHSLLTTLCEKNFTEVAENISNLKNVVSQIDENSVSSNNAIFANITDRLTVFENSLKTSLEKQEDYVESSSATLIEQISNIKELSGVLDYKVDASMIELTNSKNEFVALKSAVDSVLALDFVEKVKDLKSDLFEIKKDITSAIENSSTDITEKYSSDLFGKYELLVGKIDSAEVEITSVQKNALSAFKESIDNISSSIVDILSYVSSAQDINLDSLESKIDDIGKVVCDNNLNYVENVRDIVDVIRAQVDEDIRKIQEDTFNQVGTLKDSLSTVNIGLKQDIQNSYDKLVDVFNKVTDLREDLCTSNNSISNNFNEVISTAGTLKNDFESKLSILKDSILEKVVEIKKDLTYVNADNISELKLTTEDLHSKTLQNSVDIKNELRGEVAQLIGSLKLNVEELAENLSSTMLKTEGVGQNIVKYIQEDFTSNVISSIDSMEVSLTSNSDQILSKINEVGSNTLFESNKNATQVNASLQNLSNNLDNKLNDVESSLCSLQESTKENLDQSIQQLGSKVVDLEISVNTTAENASNNLDLNMQNVGAKLNTLEDSINSLSESSSYTLKSSMMDIDGKLSGLEQTVNNLSSNTTSALGSALESVTGNIETKFNSLEDTVNNLEENTTNNLNSVNNNISNNFNNFEKTMKQSSDNIINSLEDVSENIESKVDSITNTVSNFSNNAISSINDSLNSFDFQLNDLSDKVMSSNDSTVKTIGSSLDNVIQKIDSKLENLKNDVNDYNNTSVLSMTNSLNNVAQNFSFKMEDLGNNVVESNSSTLQSVNQSLNDVSKNINEKLEGLSSSVAESNNATAQYVNDSISDTVQVLDAKLSSLESVVNNSTVSTVSSVNAFSKDIDAKLNSIENSVNLSSSNTEKTLNNSVQDLTGALDVKLQNLSNIVTSSCETNEQSLNNTLEKLNQNFNSLENLVDSLKNESSSSINECIQVVKADLASLLTTVNHVDTNIDEDLTRQLSILETNFELLNQELVELFAQNNEHLTQNINEVFYNISNDIKDTIIQNLSDYKGQVEGLFTNITNKNDAQAEYISEKVIELNQILNETLEEQSKNVDSNLAIISEKMKSILDENLELNNNDYETLKNNLYDFAKNMEAQNNVLLEQVESKFSEISLLLGQNFDSQIQVVVSKFQSIFSNIQDLINKMDSTDESVTFNINSIKTSFEDLSNSVNAMFEQHSMNMLTSLSNDNSKMQEEWNIHAAEIRNSFESLNERLDKDEVSRLNIVQSQVKELNANFNIIADDIKNRIADDVAAVVEQIVNKGKLLLESFDLSLVEKVQEIKDAGTQNLESQKQTLENLSQKIIENIEISRQTSVGCRDFINNFVKNELSIVSENIEKETDTLVKDLYEQFGQLKDFQKDEYSKLIVNVENIVEDQIYNNISDLKAYLDIKTDTSNLSTKIDTFGQELKQSASGILAASNNLLQASVFDDAIADMKVANEVLINTMVETLNEKFQNFIKTNVTKNISDNFNLFDKKFVDTVVDKYEEIKLISSKYNNSFVSIEASIKDLVGGFVDSKDDIKNTMQSLFTGLNGSLDQLSLSFADLKAQIMSKSFAESFQNSVNNQIQSLEDLMQKQFGYLEDISELCGNNLPELTEMNAIVKYNIVQSVNNIAEKIDSQETSVQKELDKLKTDLITNFLNIFNQISFVAEQEEILDFIQEKHSELITVLSHIVTTIDDVTEVKGNLAIVDNKVDVLKEDIDLINEKISAIISSSGDIDYVYSFQDLEADIANLRISLKEVKESNQSKELDDLIESTNGIYALVDSIKQEMANLGVRDFKEDFEALNEDIVSISTRTNKLILASDESNKNLQENLQDFKLVINDLDERTRNFAQEAGLDVINNKLGALNSLIQSGAKTNQVFNQVFEYLAEWVDKAGEQITTISDKVDTLDDIGQIKVMLEDLKAESEDNSETNELIEALGTIFDKQAKRIASLEAKLDRVIVETTINSKNNKVDVSPLEDTLNKFLVAIDDKMIVQQKKIDVLESKIEDVVSLVNPKDTAQLTKKVGGMDRQIAKLNKSIEKIASHVVEK